MKPRIIFKKIYPDWSKGGKESISYPFPVLNLKSKTIELLEENLGETFLR